MIETLGFWPWLQGNFVLFALATIPAWYRCFSKHLALRLLILYGAIMVVNGGIHVGTALVLWRYDPGCFSGIALIVIGVLLAHAAVLGRRTAVQLARMAR